MKTIKLPEDDWRVIAEALSFAVDIIEIELDEADQGSDREASLMAMRFKATELVELISK